MSLGELASIAEAKLSNEAFASKMIQDVADLKHAGPEDISWAFIPSVREDLKNTKAGAVIVPEKFLDYVPAETVALVSKDPHRSYGLVASAFYPRRIDGGISDKAIIDPTAQLGADCEVAPGAVIGPNVQLGARCKIGANAVIEEAISLISSVFCFGISTSKYPLERSESAPCISFTLLAFQRETIAARTAETIRANGSEIQKERKRLLATKSVGE